MCNGDYMLCFLPYFLHLSGVIESYSGSKLPLNGCICDYAWSCSEVIMLCFFPNFLHLPGVFDLCMLQTNCKPDQFINRPLVYKPVSRFVIRLARF